jgi:hypothetical protein
MTDVKLGVQIFEKALDYHDVPANNALERFNDTPHVEISPRDVQEMWLVLLQAVIKGKDLEKAMELLNRATDMMERKRSRLYPREPLKSFIFTLLLRLCLDKLPKKGAWEHGLRVTQTWVQGLTQERRYSEAESSSIQILDKFFELARRQEFHLYGSNSKKEDKVTEDASEGAGSASGPSSGSSSSSSSSNVRPCRIALDYVDEHLGLDGPLVWERPESLAKRFPKSTSADAELDYDESMCILYLRNIQHVTRFALDTGRQGADVVEKSKVESWKKMGWKAAQLLATIEGNQSFDGTEAAFLRSGTSSKTSLALTDADMRSLLG